MIDPVRPTSEELDWYLRRQSGVISCAQARDAGLSQDAVAHGVSAAWWHDLGPTLPETVDVTVPRRRNPGRQAGITVRRRDLPYQDLIGVRDLWVTDLPLTVLEASVALGTGGSELLDRALQRRVRFPAVHRAHCRNQGRRGSAAAARLLAVAADRAASHAERLLVQLLHAAGITGWELGYLINRPEAVVDEIRAALAQ